MADPVNRDSTSSPHENFVGLDRGRRSLTYVATAGALLLLAGFFLLIAMQGEASDAPALGWQEVVEGLWLLHLAAIPILLLHTSWLARILQLGPADDPIPRARFYACMGFKTAIPLLVAVTYALLRSGVVLGRQRLDTALLLSSVPLYLSIGLMMFPSAPFFQRPRPARRQEPPKPDGSPSASAEDGLHRRFAVAFSFPGERRGFVGELAAILAGRLGKGRVLYDSFHEAELARFNLDLYLPKLYQIDSELIVVFLDRDYEGKRWCGLEWRSIRQLIQTVDEHRIMLLAFDESLLRQEQGNELGVLPGDGYVFIADRPAKEIADLILERLAFERRAATAAP
ncbi:hypothetical protein [Paludisphaera soli]|uniref:hypothetical protein n=1 Tax=Paludisphaera soli TaxID=2712865 RepID=UPI0013EA5819|nr:hypothetical protein [Paludisphaera soli]